MESRVQAVADNCRLLVFFANYKLLQRPPATAGLLFFFFLVRDTEASNVYFSTPSPTTSSPSPGYVGLEEVHVKGELRTQ